MNNYIKTFYYFFFVQNFFKTKKIYFIFFLLTAVILIEMLNIGIILPFLNMIFNLDTSKSFNIFFLNFEDIIYQDKAKYILILLILSLFAIKSVILIIAIKYQASFFAEMRTRITTYFFSLYLFKPYIYFLNEKDSSKIIRNVTMLSTDYSSFLERFLLLANDFFIFMGVIIVLFIYDPLISSIVFFTLFFASIIFSHFTKKYFFNLGESILFLSSNLIKDIQEALDNILQIKLLKKTSFFKKQFDRKAKDNSTKVGKLTFLSSLPKIYIEMIAVILLFSVIFYLLYLNKSQGDILIVLTLFAIAALRILPLSNKLISFLNSASAFLPSLKLLHDELKNEKKGDAPTNQKNQRIIDMKNIKLENVAFSYADRNKQVLRDVNLTFEKNKIYGLVGETGSGKTTLLNIVVGLLKVTDGTVKYNGELINKNVDKKIAYVSQNTYLQNSSIKKNIAFGCDDFEIDLVKIKECIKLAKLEQMIEQLPLGLETNISELGANFSGGQIQRLSIARSLYAESDLIIFDEPTVSLDVKIKKDILDTISNLRENRIIIMITHSKDDLSICDTIFKIENKKILELTTK